MLKKWIAVLALGCAATAFAAERNENFKYTVSPGSYFKIENHKGHILINTHKRDTVEIKARVYSEDSDARLDWTQIRVEQFGNTVRVETEYEHQEYDDGGWWGKSVEWPYVDYEILIPDDARLRVDTHKGTFDISAPSGEVELDTHKGEGYVRNVRNSFQLDTHKGMVDVEITHFAGLEVETHKGRVQVVLPNVMDFNLWAESHKGEIIFKGRDIAMKYDEDDHHHRGEIQARHVAGSGRYPIRLSTHKGRIELEFLR